MSKNLPLLPDWRRLDQLCAGRDILIISESYDNIVEIAAHQANHITLHYPNAAKAQAAKDDIAVLGLNNIAINISPAKHLNYADDHFDVLFGQQVMHTLADLRQWLQEARRILKPEGSIMLATHLVPGSRLRGKKAHRERQAGNYVNAWWQLRQWQHRQFLSQHKWEDILLETGFEIEDVHTSVVTFDFAAWIDETSPSEKDRVRLKSMLIQAPEKVVEFLTPQFSGDRIIFCLSEINILASPKSNKDRRREYEISVDDPRPID